MCLGYFRPKKSGVPVVCECRLIVLARRPGFGDLRVPGRFVVYGEDIFVCYMLRCVFWVFPALVLTLGALIFVYCMRGVFVDRFV